MRHTHTNKHRFVITAIFYGNLVSCLILFLNNSTAKIESKLSKNRESEKVE